MPSDRDESFHERLNEIESEDFTEREDFKQRMAAAFISSIKPGKSLSASGRKKLRSSLETWGLTPEDFSEAMGITAFHMWEAFMIFMRKSLEGELKSHRDHMEKLRTPKSSRKIPIRSFIQDVTELPDNFHRTLVDPWLTDADKAFFLDAVGQPIVETGIYSNGYNSNTTYSHINHLTDDQQISWHEGQTSKTIRLARVYEVKLKAGVCFILTNLPAEKGKSSGDHGATYIDYLITDANNDLNTIKEQFTELYYQNCLFRNKITRVDFDSNGALSFSIQQVPDKPVLLDDIKQTKFDHIKTVIDNWDCLSKGERKMGLVLHGAPGSGKTASITKLIRDVAGRATVFFVNTLPATFLSQIYPWLERLGPNLIVYEDMDAIQVRRDGVGWDQPEFKFISLLLEVLDGEKEYDVITIATTNHPDRFDAAMLRPGRLGMCVEYGAPDDRLKLRIIQYYIDHYDLGKHFEADALLRDVFDNTAVLGSHISYTLRDTSRRIKLGASPNAALDEAAAEYMSEDSLGWKRIVESDRSQRKVGF